jgi:hypothetical protein
MLVVDMVVVVVVLILKQMLIEMDRDMVLLLWL